MFERYCRHLKNLSLEDVHAFLRFMQRRFAHARLQQVAGNLTFTTVLALVPLLTIALALFTMFPLFGTLRASLEAYFAQVMMPKQISGTILRYLTVFTNNAGHFSIIGVCGVVVASIALMHMIERSFNEIWRIRKSRSWAGRAVLYALVGILGPFVLGVSLTVTSHLYFATGGTLRNPSLLYSLFYALLSVAWTAVTFAILYRVIPNRAVLWREAIGGGLFAAIALEIVKRLFAAFIMAVPSYRTIYGAMAAVPIFLLWIYLSWLITLAGAAFVAGIHYLWHGRWRQVLAQHSPFLDAIEVLRVFHQHSVKNVEEIDESGLSESFFREVTGLGLDEIENLLLKMQSVGWVEQIKPDTMERIRQRKFSVEKSDYWRFIASFDALTLASVFRLFVFSAPDRSDLAGQVDAAISKSLSETLSAYFSRDSAPASSANSVSA